MRKIQIYLLALLMLPFIQSFGQKRTYVLVHGAWGGAWQFKNTHKKLEKAGENVYRVNLTGLGERVHLANDKVDLSTHVKDVVNTILFEDLDSVILMGHSYGGMVVTAVADSIPERIKKIIYLDAFVPEDGESVFEFMSQGPAKDLMNSKDGVSIFPPWVKDTTVFPRDVPHPVATLKQVIKLKNPNRLKIPSTYILTSEKQYGGKEKDDFYFFYTRANKYGWKTIDMEANHNPQVDKLDDLVKILLNEK